MQIRHDRPIHLIRRDHGNEISARRFRVHDRTSSPSAEPTPDVRRSPGHLHACRDLSSTEKRPPQPRPLNAGARYQLQESSVIAPLGTGWHVALERKATSTRRRLNQPLVPCTITFRWACPTIRRSPTTTDRRSGKELPVDHEGWKALQRDPAMTPLSHSVDDQR